MGWFNTCIRRKSMGEREHGKMKMDRDQYYASLAWNFDCTLPVEHNKIYPSTPRSSVD
jgi:hypothetical protein